MRARARATRAARRAQIRELGVASPDRAPHAAAHLCAGDRAGRREVWLASASTLQVDLREEVASTAATSPPRRPSAKRSPSAPRRPASSRCVRPLRLQVPRPREGAGRCGARRRFGVLRRRDGKWRRWQKMRGNNERSGRVLEKLVAVNRVAKVVKGGRQFGFTALTVVGDGNGRVGFGRGKAREVPAGDPEGDGERARKNMIEVALKGGTLHYADDRAPRRREGLHAAGLGRYRRHRRRPDARRVRGGSACTTCWPSASARRTRSTWCAPPSRADRDAPPGGRSPPSAARASKRSWGETMAEEKEKKGQCR